jgi:hypothetical protein
MIEDVQGLKHLQKIIRAHLNQLADDIATTDVPNFEAYRYLRGRIDGLALAERELIDLAEMMEKVND